METKAKTHFPRFERSLAALVLALLLYLTLYNPHLGWLITVGGGDAGNHASLAHSFAWTVPLPYKGFILFHLLARFLQQGGLSLFNAFSLLLIGTIFILLFTMCLSGLNLLESNSVKGKHKTLLMWSWIGIVALYFGLPLICVLHYHLSDGFFAHVFALLPLTVGMLLYSSFQSLILRLLVLSIMFGIMRFTYGLNLADLALVNAALFVWEGRLISGRLSHALLLAALCWLGLGLFLYSQLWPLRNVSGAMVAPAWRIGIVLLGLQSFGLFLQGRYDSTLDQKFRRSLYFVALFGGLSCLISIIYLGLRLPRIYYFHKYHLHALILTSAISLICVWRLYFSAEAPRLIFANIAAAMPTKPMQWLARITVFAMILGPLFLWSYAKPYRQSFWERATGLPPFEEIDALDDPEAHQVIQRVLGEKGKTFGGLYEPSWPRGNFMNGTYGLDGNEIIMGGKLLPLAGKCRFWQVGSYDLRGTADKVTPALAKAYYNFREELAECIDYRPPFVPSPLQRRLCYECG